jgi:hypothetical protein
VLNKKHNNSHPPKRGPTTRRTKAQTKAIITQLEKEGKISPELKIVEGRSGYRVILSEESIAFSIWLRRHATLCDDVIKAQKSLHNQTSPIQSNPELPELNLTTPQPFKDDLPPCEVIHGTAILMNQDKYPEHAHYKSEWICPVERQIRADMGMPTALDELSPLMKTLLRVYPYGLNPRFTQHLGMPTSRIEPNTTLRPV